MSGHCGPDKARQTPGECWPPSYRQGAKTYSPAVGSRRGVIFFPPGLSGQATPWPPGAAVNEGGLLPYRGLDLATTLSGSPHNWVVKYWPATVGYGVGALAPNAAIANDLNTDPANTGTTTGSRFMGNETAFLAHYLLGLQEDYPNFPICLFGFSWGAWTVLQTAIQFASDIVAVGAHHPPLLMNHINTSVMNLTAYTSTALDLGASALNSLSSTLPIYLGWGSADTLVDEPDGGDLLTPAMYTSAQGAGLNVTPNCNSTGTNTGGTPLSHVLTSSTDTANPNNDVFRIAAWFSSWESAYPANL